MATGISSSACPKLLSLCSLLLMFSDAGNASILNATILTALRIQAISQCCRFFAQYFQFTGFPPSATPTIYSKPVWWEVRPTFSHGSRKVYTWAPRPRDTGPDIWDLEFGVLTCKEAGQFGADGRPHRAWSSRQHPHQLSRGRAACGLCSDPVACGRI